MTTELEIALCVVVVVPLVFGVGFAPRSTEVNGNYLRVHSWFKTFNFDLTKVTSVEEIDRSSFFSLGTMRLFGVGWPARNPYGWFWKKDLGIVLSMISDRCNVVLLTMGSRKLLVSPKDHRDLIMRIEGM